MEVDNYRVSPAALRVSKQATDVTHSQSVAEGSITKSSILSEETKVSSLSAHLDRTPSVSTDH